MRWLALFTMSVLVLGALGPTSAAQAQDVAYTLLGEDPVGDARNAVAPGAELPETVGPTGFSRGKQDIRALKMGLEGDTLHVRLETVALYHGSSQLLFVVHFEHDGTTYFTCWHINSAGTTGTSVDVGEDTSSFGCTRFSLAPVSQTRVGPATRDGGVEVASDEDGPFYRWPVPLSAIGSPQRGATFTNVYAEVWNRGVNTDYAPATGPQSYYVWQRADRIPDAETFDYVLGEASLAGAPELAAGNLTAVPEASSLTVPANASATLQITFTNAAADNDTVALWLVNLTEGWQASLAAEELRLAPGASAAVNLTAAAGLGTPETGQAVVGYNSTLGVAGNLTIDLVVGPSAPDPGGEPEATGQATNGGSVPGSQVAAFVVAAALGLALARRRR